MATAPYPGTIDGDAGPVLLNDGKTRMALRRMRFHLSKPSAAQIAT
jgi:hypothetical protein